MSKGEIGVVPEISTAVPLASSNQFSMGGRMRIALEISTYKGFDRQGLVSSSLKQDDEIVIQLGQALQEALMGPVINSAGSIAMKSVLGSTYNVSVGITMSSPSISFGTGTTSATFNDYAIQTQVSAGSPVAATITQLGAGATNGTFTATGTWNNTTGSSVTVSELAMYVISLSSTNGSQTFAYTHDVFTGQSVSNGGSAAATLYFMLS